MRFSTIVASALFAGLVAAAPTKNSDMMDYNNMSEASASSSSSAAMASSTMMDDKKSHQSSSSGGCNDKSCMSSSSGSSNSGCSGESCMNNKESSSSSSMMDETTSSAKMDETTTSSMMMETSTAEATSTSTSEMSSITYGSGSSNWGGSGYNDCVQQCVASYGAPPATWTPSSTSGSSAGSVGTGVTHTVVVAPTQGVLRYVPFAVNASVGDTVMFMWNAKNHTVTKSSALEICNKTTNAPFTSGVESAPFTFTQVVNDTNPTFFYCGVPNHCQKGMFGMINPPSAYQASTSVSQAIPAALSNSSDLSAMMAYTKTYTANNEKADSWGSNIDLASLPDWSHSAVLENVMYTRSFLGANPEVLKDNGFIDMGGEAPKMIPADMAPINNAVDGNAASTSAPATGAAAGSGTAAAPESTGKSNGAASKAASTALFGAVAFAAAVLAF